MAGRPVRWSTSIAGIFRVSGFCPHSSQTISLGVIGLFLCITFAPSLLFAQDVVTIRVDAGASRLPLKPIWSYFGYDEPNYTYMKRGQSLISELSALSPEPVYLRAHNLLTSGDATPALKWGSTNAYTEDRSGRPIYDWKIVDRIFDTYLQAGAKPFVEIGFMPEALSMKPQPYRHTWPKGELYTGWSYPPSDYQKWAELIYRWVLHCVQRYGEKEVASWYWEVWNEPDIPYWHGTPEEYDKLYDFSANAVKRALPSARIGGPATTGPADQRAAAFLRQFLEHCAHGTNLATGASGSPLDFVSFHAKGALKTVEEHVQMGLAMNLLSVERGFEIAASFPRFAGLPVVLSESDPEGCAACSARDFPQNIYRNGTVYPTYTAVAFNSVLQLAVRHKINIAGMLTWAFEFEGQPYFEGFRTLATNGIDKPELNFFRMAGLMHGEQLEVESTGAVKLDTILESGVRGQPDVDALAGRTERSLTVMVWNYQDEDGPRPDASVALRIARVAPAARHLLLRHYRIDDDHSNAYTAWMRMGSPQSPTPEQYERLRAAGQLQLLDSPRWIASENGTVELAFTLPRQAISLLELSW